MLMGINEIALALESNIGSCMNRGYLLGLIITYQFRIQKVYANLKTPARQTHSQLFVSIYKEICALNIGYSGL